MPTALNHDRETMASAALRHGRDARALAPAAESLDQAWHLAGLALECAQKACLPDGRLYKAVGHLEGGGGVQLVDYAAATDPQAQRALPATPPALADWRIDSRYHPTGHTPAAQAAEAAEAVEAAVLDTLGRLWCAGHLTGGRLG